MENPEMNNDEDLKRQYKQAFSQIHIPQPITCDFEKVERKSPYMKWYQKHAIALGITAVLLGTGGIAYAANVGGIRTQVTVWISGTQRTMDATQQEDGSWSFTDPEDPDFHAGGGGVYIDENGNEIMLGAEDVAENMANDIEQEDGKTWLIRKNKKWDITELLKSANTVNLEVEGEYYEVHLQNGELLNYKITPDPDAGVQYTKLTDEEAVILDE